MCSQGTINVTAESIKGLAIVQDVVYIRKSSELYCKFHFQFHLFYRETIKKKTIKFSVRLRAQFSEHNYTVAICVPPYHIWFSRILNKNYIVTDYICLVFCQNNVFNAVFNIPPSFIYK